jgi:serine protease inhibitor
MPTATASFALQLLERLGSRQVVLSPASVQNALVALRSGVTGAAREALDTVPAADLREIDDEDVILALAQSVWLDEGRELLADLGIDVRKIDFQDPGAPEHVNAWAAEHTRGMVPRVVDRFDPEEVFALTDAVYFDGAWTEPFDPASTEPQPFTTAAGEAVIVPMMHADGSYDYFEDNDVQAVRLPYGKDGDIGFLAVIAREGLAAPTALDWDALQTSRRRGTIALPRFTATSSLELSDALRDLGLEPAFTEDRDFDGLFSGGGRKALGRVLQSAKVEVDERGTRAAAVTTVTVIATAYRPETPFELRLDRPFLWAIEDRRTGTILFLGIVTDPREEST